MKIIYKILFLFVLGVFVTSCDDDSPLATISADASTGVAQFSASSLVLDKADKEGEALTISFNNAEIGVNASKTYQLLFDLAGGDFSNPSTKGVGNEISAIFTTDEINQILINLGATPGVATELVVKIETVLSTQSSLFSEVSSLMVTPYAAELDLSSIWGLVGSATINGWDGPDMPFYKTTDTSLPAGTFVAYVTLVNGAVKVRSNNSWDVNYGSGTTDGTLDAGGGDITVTEGTYKILFNENDLSFSIDAFSWGLVGSATVNGWDGPDMPFSYNPLFDNWIAEVTLVDGQFKIRQNNAWSVNFGDSNLDGVLDTNDDNNIDISAGSYLITFNPITLEYSIE